MERTAFLFLAFLSLFFVSFFLGGYITGFFTGNLSVSVDEGIVVLYSDFDGSTTNFLILDDVELQNVSNMILEKTPFGKIIFESDINLTKDVYDNVIDLSGNIDFSQAYIYVNTDVLTSLNSEAFIYFYNLDFSNPVILKDGELCLELECHLISYIGGTIIFQVQNLSSYSVIEGPSVTPDPSGGGNSVSLETQSFFLNETLLKVESFTGEYVMKELLVTNNGTSSLLFEISLSESLGKFVILPDKYVIIEPGESKNVSLIFYSRENELPDVYTGKIFFEASEILKSINIIFEIKERNPLFDVVVDSPDKVFLGEEVLSEINITNMGNLRNIDILLYYSLKDFEGKDLVWKEESLFINEHLGVLRSLRLPESYFGDYGVFYVKVSYENISAMASDSFQVKYPLQNYDFLYVAVLLIVLALIFKLFKVKKSKRKKISRHK